MTRYDALNGENSLYRATYAYDEEGNELPRPREPPVMNDLFKPNMRTNKGLTEKELAWLNWESEE